MSRGDGVRAWAAEKKKEDPDYFIRRGAEGSRKRKTIGGFRTNKEFAREAGRKGGIQKGINHRKRMAESDMILGK